MDLNVIEFIVADLANGESKGLIGIREKQKNTGSNRWRYTDNYHIDIKRIQSTH